VRVPAPAIDGECHGVRRVPKITNRARAVPPATLLAESEKCQGFADSAPGDAGRCQATGWLVTITGGLRFAW
jgi:hypothetical protein